MGETAFKPWTDPNEPPLILVRNTTRRLGMITASRITKHAAVQA
ncbi:MAG: hypothetical protein AB8B82_12260 [Roseovarius sp.]